MNAFNIFIILKFLPLNEDDGRNRSRAGAQSSKNLQIGLPRLPNRFFAHVRVVTDLSVLCISPFPDISALGRSFP